MKNSIMNGPSLNGPALVAAVKPAVLEAGAVILDIYAQAARFDVKSDGSPVTQADEAAERIVLTALKGLDTGLAIISEENANSHQMAAPEEFILVDPLDGTREFLKRDGKGAFTVNIGLVRHGVPQLGVVYAPALGRLYWGVAGFGAFEEQIGADGSVQRAITTRAVPETGCVAVASQSHRDAETDRWLANHPDCATVSIGSSLKFCLLAAGEADLYPRFSPTMEWDTAAGDAILRAAGGSVSCPDGSPFLYGKQGYRNTAFIARGSGG